MAELQSIDQLLASEFSTKESSKENQKVQKAIANRPIGYRTEAKGSTTVKPEINRGNDGQPETAVDQPEMAEELQAQRLAKAERRSKSIRNLEIDDYLIELIIEGLIDENYQPYAAKCCHTLGLQKVNMIVNNVRGDANARDKQKLLAYKLHGALQLHHKKAFYASNRGIQI